MKSFDSIEKSLEERLDPKRRTIGESQLREHDQKKTAITYLENFSDRIFKINLRGNQIFSE